MRLNDSKAILKYLSRKFSPKLLGKTAAEMGLAEMFSLVHDTIGSTQQLVDLLADKKFMVGKEPTWVDFCVYESWVNDTALLESNDRARAYVDRVSNLPKAQELALKALSSTSSSSSML